MGDYAQYPLEQVLTNNKVGVIDTILLFRPLIYKIWLLQLKLTLQLK